MFVLDLKSEILLQGKNQNLCLVFQNYGRNLHYTVSVCLYMLQDNCVVAEAFNVNFKFHRVTLSKNVVILGRLKYQELLLIFKMKETQFDDDLK